MSGYSNLITVLKVSTNYVLLFEKQIQQSLNYEFDPRQTAVEQETGTPTCLERDDPPL